MTNEFEVKIDDVVYEVDIISYQPYIPAHLSTFDGAGFGDAEPPEEEHLEFTLTDEWGEQFEADEVEGSHEIVLEALVKLQEEL